MAIYELDNGKFVISSREMWLPGIYDTERAARYAFQFSNEQLRALMDRKVSESGPDDAVITSDDLKAIPHKDKDA